MNVLVVIPTLNEAERIEDLLEQLVRDDGGGHRLEFVVADGGSTDGTQRLVQRVSERHPNVRLLHNPDRTQSTGINRAVQRFGHDTDVLIRCDAHAGYPPGFCSRLLATLERTAADAVVVPLDSVGDGALQRAIAWTCNSPFGTGGAAHRAGLKSGFVDHGHHAAFRMDTFRACGGYDASFVCNEDAELDCRQRALGAKVYLDASVRVRYYPRRTFAALWTQYFRYGEGRSRTVRRHPHSLRLRQLLVPGQFLACALAVLLSARWPALLVWPALYVGFSAVHSLALLLLHRAPAALLGGPAALVMHAAWAFGFVWGLAKRREARWSPQQALPLWVPHSVPVDGR